VNEQPYLNAGPRAWGAEAKHNASRREFIADGLPAERISRVVGVADREPPVPDDPTSPRNRRISIVLLREPRLHCREPHRADLPPWRWRGAGQVGHNRVNAPERAATA
jgi:hypothetical protein